MSLARLLYKLLSLYEFGLIIYCVMDWIQMPRDSSARVFLSKLYEPILRPIRRALQPVRMGAAMVDLSPIVLFLILIVLQRFVAKQL